MGKWRAGRSSRCCQFLRRSARKGDERSTAHSQCGSCDIGVGDIGVGNMGVGNIAHHRLAVHRGITPSRCRRAWGFMAFVKQGCGHFRYLVCIFRCRNCLFAGGLKLITLRPSRHFDLVGDLLADFV